MSPGPPLQKVQQPMALSFSPQAPKPILSVLQSLSSSSSLPHNREPHSHTQQSRCAPWPVLPLAREQHEALQDPADNS